MGRWATILLALWLIVMGAILMLNLHFDFQGLIVGGMAIAAGVLILLGK